MRPDSEQAPTSRLAVRRWRPTGKALLLAALIVLMLATHGQVFTPAVRGLYLCAELLHLRQARQQLCYDNEALADSVAYLQTDEGRKLAARHELEALEPSERVVVIKEQQDASQPAPARIPQRLRAWLGERCNQGRQSVHHAVAIVKHWLGLAETSALKPASPETAGEVSSKEG